MDDTTVWIVAITGFTTLAAGLGSAWITASRASESQEDALAHDREMNDLSELRNDIKRITDMLESAHDDLSTAFLNISERRASPDWVKAATTLTPALKGLVELSYEQARFMVRFPPEHGFPEALEVWASELRDFEQVTAAALKDRRQITAAEIAAHNERLGTAQAAFGAQAFLTAGLRLPQHLGDQVPGDTKD